MSGTRAETMESPSVPALLLSITPVKMCTCLARQAPELWPALGQDCGPYLDQDWEFPASNLGTEFVQSKLDTTNETLPK